MRPVRDWLANVAIAALVAVVTIVLALPAHAQTITWKVDGPASCTVTCTPAGTPPGPPLPPVEPPPQPPVAPPPATDPCAHVAGNFMLYSYCRQGVDTSGQPAGTGSGQPSDFTGFNLERKGHPYRNSLAAGVTYQFVAQTAPGERVELTLLEVVGTPDSMTTKSHVQTDAGATLSPEVVSGRHGKHTFTSPGGRATLVLTPSVTGPLGVQRN